MATLKRVILNSVTLYPTTIKTEDVRITYNSSPVRMLNGGLRVWHTTFKKKWELTWDSIHEDYVPAIRNIFRTTAAITFNDPDNVSYSVVTTGFTENLSAEQISLAGKMYYNLTLTFEQV